MGAVAEEWGAGGVLRQEPACFGVDDPVCHWHDWMGTAQRMQLKKVLFTPT